jgi:hypothetical protein
MSPNNLKYQTLWDQNIGFQLSPSGIPGKHGVFFIEQQLRAGVCGIDAVM